MSSNLRFILALLGVGAVGAALSLAVLGWQDAHRARIVAEQSTGGSVEAGRAAIVRYECGACHAIDGIRGPRGMVGPALDGFASRGNIAGVLANEPDNLVRWLRHPQLVLPGNGMPEQGIDDHDARDMAAYLYTLRD